MGPVGEPHAQKACPFWHWVVYLFVLVILSPLSLLALLLVVGPVTGGLLERSPYEPFLFTSPLAGLLAGWLGGRAFSKLEGFTTRKRRRTIWCSALLTILFSAYLAIGVNGFFPSYLGRNESCGISALSEYVAAQRQFYEMDPDGDGVHEYAKSLSELHRAGLIEERFARAEGLPGQAKSWHGYVFKVLTAQGPDVPGGAKSYLTAKEPDGRARLTDGFALVATPRVYDQTGRSTFVVNQSGVVYQSDFLDETVKVYEQMMEYNPNPNPGKGWWRSD